MEGFRSICFVYNKDDAYNVCYLKEFFKWIGLSYVDDLHDPAKCLFEDAEKNAFDIIVNMNKTLSESEQDRLRSVLNSRFISIETSGSGQDADEEMLNRLLRIIMKEYLGDENCQLLLRLAQIYKEEHLVSVLYDYTFVLLEKMERDVYFRIYDKFHVALSKVEKELKDCREKCFNSKANQFTEYGLYAKYSCQKKINEILLMCGRAVEFPVEDYLTNCNEIYNYDDKFFKVEYLKAKVADQDCRFSALSRFFLENCVEKCPVELCRSYHYYSLAKWREKGKQTYEASKAYRSSYQSNPSNIKAVFKIAVEKKDNGNPELAVRFLQEIMDVWRDEDNKGSMPPREIEYAYKTRMLMAELKEEHQKDFYMRNAQEYLQFIEDLECAEEIPEDYFLKRMYTNPGELTEICNAILRRNNIRCINQM